MKPIQIYNRQEELFQPRLCGQLNQKKELLLLGRMIPWGDLEIEIDSACVDRGYKGQGVESDPLQNHTKSSSLGKKPKFWARIFLGKVCVKFGS